MQEARIDLPRWETLPDIGLYMDQVITMMERTFSSVLPQGEITKSMVNNYVKVGLIPRPLGKKYDREHLALLMIIAVLKQALSMESISQMLGYLCQDGVQEGYTRFSEDVRALSESVWDGQVYPEPACSTPQAQAVRAGVTAAVCTLHARRLLGSLREENLHIEKK